MKYIYGKTIAEKIMRDVKSQVKRLPMQPVFCDILVGDDKPSISYVKIKGAKAESLGMKFLPIFLPGNTKFKTLKRIIEELNSRQDICGLVVQLPLPKSLPKQKVLDLIRPEIDIDCLTSKNSRGFYRGKKVFQPPAAAAVMEILRASRKNFTASKIVVIGQGSLVGRPVVYLLKQAGSSPVVVTKETKKVDTLLSDADVIVSATGQKKLIGSQSLKKGALVIDAGTSEEKGGIVGDIDLLAMKKKPVELTPVPGGVGPVTVAMLMKNVLLAAKNLL